MILTPIGWNSGHACMAAQGACAPGFAVPRAGAFAVSPAGDRAPREAGAR